MMSAFIGLLGEPSTYITSPIVPSPSLPPSSLPALPPRRWLVNDNNWFDRILCRLVDAERHEPELRFRDDYRIARLTVANCQVDLEQPWELAFSFYLGKHPNKLLPLFLERARAHEAMEPKFAESLPTPPVLSTLARVDGDSAIQVSDAATQGSRPCQSARAVRAGLAPRNSPRKLDATG